MCTINEWCLAYNGFPLLLSLLLLLLPFWCWNSYCCGFRCCFATFPVLIYPGTSQPCECTRVTLSHSHKRGSTRTLFSPTASSTSGSKGLPNWLDVTWRDLSRTSHTARKSSQAITPSINTHGRSNTTKPLAWHISVSTQTKTFAQAFISSSKAWTPTMRLETTTTTNQQQEDTQ